MNYLELLKSQFNGHLDVREKRPGVVQLLVPLFHEDGDMVDIFLEESPDERGDIRVNDSGMTLMRLSYSYDIDTPNKEKILRKILAENRVGFDEGNIYVDAKPEGLYPAVLQFAQTVAKVSSMKAFKREMVQGLFYEMLDEFIKEELVRFRPATRVLPIPDRDDLEVPYAFETKHHPIFLFPVKDNDSARLATISCLEFQRRKLPFHSCAVHENVEALSRKDRVRILSATDKQFPYLEDFKQHAVEYLERESA
ncbi:MAG: DUF1828 domain-containing protein [Cyanobacteria bacterium NC_groundwater_1444_Ag_S-0.65um_54_12]|nr:DUF1828 domain-containing protein [Cyanobacteria bacterium NC_groundwater_1444_Ag_S-0.65um_54_12]